MKFSSSLLLISCSIAVSAETRGKEGGFSVADGERKLQGVEKDDDPNFRYIYENKKGKVLDMGGCEFVAKMPKKRCKLRIGGKKVVHSCPTACGKQIENKEHKKKMKMKKKKDNDDFKYFYKNKNGEEVMKENGCEFVSKRAEQRCQKVLKGDKVSDMCPKTCEGYEYEDNFTLEGTRTYIGCSAEFFEMTISCGDFGDDDEELCLLRAVGMGELVEGEDGQNYIETFPDYVPDIDDVDPDKICKASGTFSLDRVTEDEIEAIPLTVSAGCSFQGVTQDWQYVLKGKIDRKENIIHLSYSSDYGFSYYTDAIDTPEVYTAIPSEELEETVDDHDDNHDDRRLSHNSVCWGGRRLSERRLSHLSGGRYCLPSWYVFWLQSRGYSIPGCAGRSPTRRPTVSPTASPATTAPVTSGSPVSTRAPGTRDLGDASSKKETTQNVII